MKRSLRYERKFPFEQYGNITLVDEILDLPEEVSLNPDLVGKIQYLQMLDVELAYRAYFELYKEAKTLAVESIAEAVSFLEAKKEETMAQIRDILNPKEEEGE